VGRPIPSRRTRSRQRLEGQLPRELRVEDGADAQPPAHRAAQALRRTQGQEPRPESRQTFAAMVQADNPASREVTAKAGIKLE
jgi:hypothetical protein